MKKYGLMIDMDGVIYAGQELIKGGDTFVKWLLYEQIPLPSFRITASGRGAKPWKNFIRSALRV